MKKSKHRLKDHKWSILSSDEKLKRTVNRYYRRTFINRLQAIKTLDVTKRLK